MARHHTHESLIFAWGARDHSAWHLVAALLLLIGTMVGFFFVFRIVHPVAQRAPSTPQHVIALDPSDPAALAIIHRAQDRSFALLSDADPADDRKAGMLAFHPSFEGYQPVLRKPVPATTTARQPHLFTPGMDVLPPVPRRAAELPDVAPPAKLQAVMSGALAKRGPAVIELEGIAITQPARVQFRVAIGAAGQVITALPLTITDDKEVMKRLQSAVNALRFTPAAARRVEWGEVSFRWEGARKP